MTAGTEGVERPKVEGPKVERPKVGESDGPVVGDSGGPVSFSCPGGITDWGNVVVVGTEKGVGGNLVEGMVVMLGVGCNVLVLIFSSLGRVD